jgi:hypothetical protein
MTLIPRPDNPGSGGQRTTRPGRGRYGRPRGLARNGTAASSHTVVEESLKRYVTVPRTCLPRRSKVPVTVNRELLELRSVHRNAPVERTAVPTGVSLEAPRRVVTGSGPSPVSRHKAVTRTDEPGSNDAPSSATNNLTSLGQSLHDAPYTSLPT